MIGFFEKNMSYIPVDNGSSLNVAIRMKIITFTYIIVIETSVLALYLLVHYLIFNFPLLCTSSWRFKIRLPVIYIVIEFSPDDQIQAKFFVSINGTKIYISSIKFVLNGAILIELRFITFPLTVSMEIIFHFNT